MALCTGTGPVPACHLGRAGGGGAVHSYRSVVVWLPKLGAHWTAAWPDTSRCQQHAKTTRTTHAPPRCTTLYNTPPHTTRHKRTPSRNTTHGVQSERYGSGRVKTVYGKRALPLCRRLLAPTVPVLAHWGQPSGQVGRGLERLGGA